MDDIYIREGDQGHELHNPLKLVRWFIEEKSAWFLAFLKPCSLVCISFFLVSLFRNVTFYKFMPQPTLLPGVSSQSIEGCAPESIVSCNVSLSKQFYHKNVC